MNTMFQIFPTIFHFIRCVSFSSFFFRLICRMYHTVGLVSFIMLSGKKNLKINQKIQNVWVRYHTVEFRIVNIPTTITTEQTHIVCRVRKNSKTKENRKIS